MRWSVYAVDRTSRTVPILIGLGYVNAPHQPAAIMAARRRWRKLARPNQAQFGFSVRPYKADRLSLGKLFKRTQ